jgi:hypothetical protein
LRAAPETDPVLAKIREVIAVTAFHPAPPRPLFEPDGRRLAVPMPELIAETERRLMVPMPSWLRAGYQSCNGYAGPYGVGVLYPLDGSEGVGDFTLFLREQGWAPKWLQWAIVFGHIRGSGSMTTHSVALGGHLVEWCYGDGDLFTVLEGGLIDLWRRIQTEWDAVG